GSGLALDREQDGAPYSVFLVVKPGRSFVILDAIPYSAHIRETHRRSIAVGNDERDIVRCLIQLAGRLNDECLIRAKQSTGWKIDVTALDRLCHFINTHLAAGQLPRIKR